MVPRYVSHARHVHIAIEAGTSVASLEMFAQKRGRCAPHLIGRVSFHSDGLRKSLSTSTNSFGVSRGKEVAARQHDMLRVGRSCCDQWVVPGATPVRATVEARLANPKYLFEIVVTAAT